MYDPQRDVAKKANLAFDELFSEEKRNRTLGFCYAEIMQVIRTNLMEV